MHLMIRAYMSISHIQSAAFFARQALAIEEAHDGTYNADALADHLAFVSGAVMSAVGFLEASVNELCTDAAEGNTSHWQGLSPGALASISNMWALGVPKSAGYPVLRKYEIALALSGGAPFDRGAKPFQDADALVRLRNKLVHYEPETIPAESSRKADDVHVLERLLKSRFSLNPLVSTNNPFWPSKCLSYGCARWAVESSVQFADSFFSKLGVTPIPYDHLRGRL